ncbi:sce7726 family protein [Parageobacillus toebii]|uniref:sce7726 family protein n=1 Tax=Parageobacillus toebii TaxID=153151 RepID=UPI0028151729|nr:sce7726 family protein [Parageobacillus toebii]WMT19186.1 sce7726 family protein [Parageobacillus toebii]
MSMLTDFDIRAKLIKRIEKENQNKHYRIIEELSICDGRARADVVVANGFLHGYEIKSDHDTLERLDRQIEWYDMTFDKVTIVVGKKFASNIINLVPEHWGIEVAYLNKFNQVSIKKVRACKKNKNVLGDKLLDLLWNDELKLLLKQNNVKNFSRKPKPELKKMVLESISFSDIRNFTRETLKTRVGWRDSLG